MKKLILSMLAVSAMVFTSCKDDDGKKAGTPDKDVELIEVPTDYEFKNAEGKSTVSYSGQLARLAMANELKSALGNEASTEEALNKMFKDGKGFAGEGLDASGKKLRSTVASGSEKKTSFSTVEAEALRTKMDGWLKEFVAMDKTQDGSKGTAGKIVYKDGAKKGFFSAKGLEYNQAVAKTMIGAIMLDQVINKYISKAGLEKDQEANDKVAEGKVYTTLEHHWDEAYGYVFGKVDDKTVFLGKYLGGVDKQPAFKGTLTNIETAFRTGRTAIVNKQYDVMHKQAAIIRAELSKGVAVKTVYYLASSVGKDRAEVLHGLSEAYGFMHAMQFAHIAGTQTGVKNVEAHIQTLDNLWTVDDTALTAIAEGLAKYYGFSVEDATTKE